MKKRRQLFKLPLNACPANARSKATFSMATAVRVKYTGRLRPPQEAALLRATEVVAFSR